MTAADPSADLMRALATPAGKDLLAGLPEYDESTVLAVTSRLRAAGVDPGLVSAALTQARLRTRARARLGPVADRLLLTQDGLEQATRTALARLHAQRFLDAGVEHVWDLGSGLGLDAMAFADAGLAVTAVERDPEVSAAASANLSSYPHARVLTGDASAHLPTAVDGAWLDPARRVPGVADITGRTRRLWRLDQLSPSWEQVQEVAGRAAATGAKLSPGFSPSDLPPGAEAQWCSLNGDVLECALWWGAAVRRPGISVAIGTSGEREGWTVVQPVPDPPDPLASGDAVGPWLAEPDRAVLAAGMAGALAAAVDGHELDAGVGYVCAARPLSLTWARWYAVEEVMPLHVKTVRSRLRQHGVGQVTIKKRGVPTDPVRFHADLRLPRGASGRATLILTRVAGRPAALLVRPTTPEELLAR